MTKVNQVEWYMKVLQASPVLVYSNTISIFVMTQDYIHLYFWVGSYLLNNLTNCRLKKIFQHYFGDIRMFKRPNPPREGCGPFADLSFPGSRSFGFPSGHAQTMFFYSIFYTLIYPTNYLLIIVLWMSSILVCYQRVETGCHNIIQVFGGGVFGIIFGVLWYTLKLILF